MLTSYSRYNQIDKSKVLEKASWLRERGNKWKNVYINSDKTQEEKEQDYRLRQERRRRLENGEKDLIIYKGEITTKQALQQETGTEVSDIQPQTRNQGQGNSRSRPPKGTGGGRGGGRT